MGPDPTWSTSRVAYAIDKDANSPQSTSIRCQVEIDIRERGIGDPDYGKDNDQPKSFPETSLKR